MGETHTSRSVVPRTGLPNQSASAASGPASSDRGRPATYAVLGGS